MSESSPSAAPKPARLRSLDALRGFDMLWIVGLAGLFRELSKVMDVGWIDAWAGQLEHVDWAGLRAYDLIFPTFMFLSGVSVPFALGKKGEGSRAGLWFKVLRRTFLLVLLGAIYNGLLNFDFAHQRYASVLAQIGIAYGIAASVFLVTKSWKGRAIVCIGILAGIAILQLLVPVPGYGAGVLTPDGVINAWFDRQFLPGRLHGGTFDPEGLLCIVSAAALTLGGVLTGDFVKSRGDRPRLSTVPILLLAGALLIGAGWLCWHSGYPPIKSAWNTTFNFLAGGIALGLFAFFHLTVDFLPGFNWSFPLQVVGMNPLTIYLGTRIVPFATITGFFLNGVARLSDPWGGVILAAGVLILEWLVLFFLYRKRIFLRV